MKRAADSFWKKNQIETNEARRRKGLDLGYESGFLGTRRGDSFRKRMGTKNGKDWETRRMRAWILFFLHFFENLGESDVQIGIEIRGGG